MPKRSFDATAAAAAAESSMEKVQRKTERSHEENQERAYIAASRRADRSIEARVQSAKMASEIHKKRTGKAFKVSEEIVMKEEMYEEEDDDLPRHYRALAAHLHPAGSPDLFDRMHAFVTSNVAMRSIARQNEINRKFAESFPNYNQPQPAYPAPYPEKSQQQAPPPTSQTFLELSIPRRRRQSGASSRPSGASRRFSMAMSPTNSPVSRHSSVDASASPPALSFGSGQTPSTPVMYNSETQQASVTGTTSSVTVDPLLVTAELPRNYPFTSELPNEVKQIVSPDFSDLTTAALFGSDSLGVELPAAGDWGYLGLGDNPQTRPASKEAPPRPTRPSADYLNDTYHPTSQWLDLPGQHSTIGTPGGGMGGDFWDTFLHENIYANDEQH